VGHWSGGRLEPAESGITKQRPYRTREVESGKRPEGFRKCTFPVSPGGAARGSQVKHDEHGSVWSLTPLGMVDRIGGVMK
jgi:hypothetical protein